MFRVDIAWRTWFPSLPRLSTRRVGLTLFASGIVALLALSGWKQIEAVGASAAADLIELLELRSPGERGNAMLAKSKRERVSERVVPLVPADEPQERVLGKVFPPLEDESPFLEDQLISLIPLVPQDAPFELTELTPTSPAGGPPVGGFPGFPIFGGGGGGPGGGGPGGGGPGGGGPGGGGPGPNPPDVIVPPPAVPEPGTWALMLVGVFFCAAGLRRHRRQQLDQLASKCAPGC